MYLVWEKPLAHFTCLLWQVCQPRLTNNLYFSHSKTIFVCFWKLYFCVLFGDRFGKLCHDLCRRCDRLDFLQLLYNDLWKQLLDVAISIFLSQLLSSLMQQSDYCTITKCEFSDFFRVTNRQLFINRFWAVWILENRSGEKGAHIIEISLPWRRSTLWAPELNAGPHWLVW